MSFFDKVKHETKKSAKKAQRGINDKLNPKTRSQIEAEIKTDLEMIENDFKYQITRQFQIRNKEGLSSTAKDNCDSRIEVCLGALNLIKLAKEDLAQQSTAAALAKDMRDLGRTMKIMNRLFNMGPQLKASYLNKQIAKMAENTAKAKDSMKIREILDQHTMEEMGKNWNDMVQQVIHGDMTVDEFILRSGDDNPHAKTYRQSSLESNDDFYKRMNEWDNRGYVKNSDDVEKYADSINRWADDLDALGKSQFDKDIDEIF